MIWLGPNPSSTVYNAKASFSLKRLQCLHYKQQTFIHMFTFYTVYTHIFVYLLFKWSAYIQGDEELTANVKAVSFYENVVWAGSVPIWWTTGQMFGVIFGVILKTGLRQRLLI